MTESTEDNPGIAGETAPASEPEHTSAAARRRTNLLVRLIWIVALAYVGVLAIGAGFAYWTGLPGMCTGCHEMQPSVSSWQTSPHAHAACPMCHEPKTDVFHFPSTLAFRAAMLQRDWNAHRANPYATTLTTATISYRPVPDENCLQCHDLTREVTLPPGLTMQHNKHAARNKSCISCHLYTAHPPPASEAPLVLMQRCFTCHGRVPGSKAPGNCSLCHPASFAARPSSHSPLSSWLAGHGPIAKADRQPCAMCHDDSFCRGCHRIDMPHPPGWAQGQPVPLHAAVAKQDVTVCEHCHGPAPNLCSMCHHKGLMTVPGKPWASNHAPTVNQRGASFCLSCHDQLFCFGCHGRPGGPTATPPSKT